MPTTKLRDVSQPVVQPNVAAFLKEVKELGLGYTMTSAQRALTYKGKKHDHSESSSHRHGFACDIGIKKKEGDDMSFIEFMFGKGFDPQKKVDGDFVRPDLTPEAVALFKKHNIRLIDERLAKGGAHYHFEAVDSTNATIVEAGGKANFSTSPKQGNTDKDMYFYGGDSKVFVENDYNTTKEYNDTIVKGKKVNIISNEAGIIDTNKTFQVIPSTVIPKGGDLSTTTSSGEVGEKAIDNKYLMIDAIKSEYPDINEQGIAAIMANVELESGGGKSGRERPYTLEQVYRKHTKASAAKWNKLNPNKTPTSAGKYVQNIKSIRKNVEALGFGDPKNLSKEKVKQWNDRLKQNPDSIIGAMYMQDFNATWAGGSGPLQLTIANYGGNQKKVLALKKLARDQNMEFNDYMEKFSSDPAFGLQETLKYYKSTGNKAWSTESLNTTDAQTLGDTVINPHRKHLNDEKWKTYQAAGNASIRDYNINYSPARIEKGLQEEYEKYVNEQSGEGVDDENILSYEDYYKQIGEIGSPKAQKLKRDSLQGLGPRVEKTEEKEEKKEEAGVVGKVDEDGQLDLRPTPVAPGTTISDKNEVDFGGHIQKQKDELNKKKEQENKEKEKVYQPKKLVPLGDLTEEEINNLTNEERKQYGLQPTGDVVEKKLVPLESLSDEERAALSNEEREAYGLERLISDEEKVVRDEEERLRFKKEEEEEMLYSQQQDEKRKTKGKGRDKKVETAMVDKDGDGIPDTIDADAGEPTGGPTPENQLTVSTEEQVVIDEQQKKEALETVETEEIEVLDANGNIKKITVPTVKTPTTVETEGVETPEKIVEEKPELVKPKLKDFKTSSDYMKARMKYFKNVEDQDTLDFDNELDDDEIKETVDMEQNSAFIDSSKRNIFKTNGKSNIFNSIIGDIDNLAKGIQGKLNNITKSINNRD